MNNGQSLEYNGLCEIFRWILAITSGTVYGIAGDRVSEAIHDELCRIAYRLLVRIRLSCFADSSSTAGDPLRLLAVFMMLVYPAQRDGRSYLAVFDHFRLSHSMHERLGTCSFWMNLTLIVTLIKMVALSTVTHNGKRT